MFYLLQKIPESQYDFIMKSLLTSNDYVFSLASLQLNCFNEKCTSHLVASENENLGSYSSKTISYVGGDAKQSQGNFKLILNCEITKKTNLFSTIRD